MKQVDIKQASESQLRDFGRDTLGLNLPPNCKIDTLRSKVSAAWDKDFILVVEAADTSPQVGSDPQPITPEQQPPEDSMVRIIITVTEEAGGNQPVPVSVNGKAMLIPRNEEVDIPFKYYEALKHAVAHKYDPLPDGGLNPIPREVPRYPFQKVA